MKRVTEVIVAGYDSGAILPFAQLGMAATKNDEQFAETVFQADFPSAEAIDQTRGGFTAAPRSARCCSARSAPIDVSISAAESNESKVSNEIQVE